MITKLQQPQVELILPHIKRVLETGNPWEDDSFHYPVMLLVDWILSSIPGLKPKALKDPQYGIEGFETNGWEWDWVQHFTYQGKEYVLSGSGYYGGLAFNLKD